MGSGSTELQGPGILSLISRISRPRSCHRRDLGVFLSSCSSQETHLWLRLLWTHGVFPSVPEKAVALEFPVLPLGLSQNLMDAGWPMTVLQADESPLFAWSDLLAGNLKKIQGFLLLGKTVRVIA